MQGLLIWIACFLAISGRVFASEGLKKEEVANVFRTNLNEIRRCYEQYLERSPKERNGYMKVSIIIGGSGLVNKVRVLRTDLTEKKFKICLLEVLGSWKFPKPRGGKEVVVNYPLHFTDPYQD